jgi:hypothetical protein
MFAAYTRALEKHPLLTKVVTSTVLFGAGDLMSQKLEGKATVDTARFARMAAWGAIFTPFAHVWYNQLDKMIPGSGAVVVASKVVADQVRLLRPHAGPLPPPRLTRRHARARAHAPAPRSSHGPCLLTAAFSGPQR